MIATEGTPASALAPPDHDDEWYVYQDDGEHVGPLMLAELARNLVDGAIPRSAFAGFAGEGRWRRVTEISELTTAIRTLEGTAPTSRVPSSVAPAAPPLGFVSPPRTSQVPDAPISLAPDAQRSPKEVAAPVVATMPVAIVSDEALAEAIVIEADRSSGRQIRQTGSKTRPSDLRFRFLPFAIFGVCALVAAVEIVVVLVLG